MLPRELIYTDRDDIQSFIDESSLNKELYDWICSLKIKAEGRAPLKRDPLDLFNQAYYYCTVLLCLPEPARLCTDWGFGYYMQDNFKNYEVRIYESVAYALLALQSVKDEKVKSIERALRGKYNGEHHYFPAVNEIVTRRIDNKQYVVTDFSKKKLDYSKFHTINWSRHTNGYSVDAIRLCVAECSTQEEKIAVIQAIKKRFKIEYPDGSKLDYREEEAEKYLRSAIQLIHLESGENNQAIAPQQEEESDSKIIEVIDNAIRHNCEENFMARGPYKLTLKNNNPDFMHFYLYWDFQGIGVLDFHLSEEINSEVYDVYLKARANFDSEIGKQIYQENEEFFDDASYFDDAYEVCASCWRRVDPYKLIHPVKIQEGEGGVPDERDYYWDIVASMAYMILSLQSALPNVAVKLIQFIERRQKGDTLFFPYFAKRTAELLSEGTHFDTEFASFLFPKSLTINDTELSKKNILSYISRCVNDDTQLDIVQQFESMIADADSMSHKDKEELNQFLRLIETRVKKLCMATPSLEFKDFFLPAKEAEAALGYNRETFAVIESQDNPKQDTLPQRLDKITGDLFTETSDSTDKDETIKKLEEEISRLKSELEDQENKDSNAFPIKPRIRVMIELLKLINAGPNTNDMTKIARLISYITGSGSKKVYRLIQEGYQLTDYHEEAIKEANDALQDLSIKIKINKD